MFAETMIANFLYSPTRRGAFNARPEQKSPFCDPNDPKNLTFPKYL